MFGMLSRIGIYDTVGVRRIHHDNLKMYEFPEGEKYYRQGQRPCKNKEEKKSHYPEGVK